MEIKKLTELGKSLVWLLGFIILVSQTYRIVAYYVFSIAFDVDFRVDGAFAFLGFCMMFVQSALKTAARKILTRKTNS